MDQQVGDTDISYHMPVWIKARNANWGSKPFRIFNRWYEHHDFMKFVKNGILSMLRVMMPMWLEKNFNY